MISRLGQRALIAVFVAVGSACGVRTVTTDVNPAISRQPTCDEAVTVYTSRSQVPHDYYELAFISAEANSIYTSDGRVLSQIRKKAAEVGANGIIANPVQESSATVKVIGEAIGAQSATKKATALAIYMPEEGARVMAQCGR